MRRRFAPLALLAVLLALPGALAQETVPILVERVDAGNLAADLESAAMASFSLFNLNPREDFYVSIQVDGPAAWSTGVSMDRFLLAPRNTTVVNVTFDPTEPPRDEATFEVIFSFVRVDTGAVTKVSETVTVGSRAPPLVLDAFPNLLPPPLNNAYGTFLVDMLFWTTFAIAAIFVGDAVVRFVTTRAPNDVTREIIQKLRRPVFLFVFFLGLARSFAILPSNFFTDVLTKTLAAIGVAIFGLYVAYRVLDAVLLYYQRTWASRTATLLDDVLVPLLRKVGIVVLYVVGIIVVLRNLGWDPTVVLAGAGIAGLVIAFAAQDTFSNLFSGVFILLDRPFKEGDDIMMETGEFVRVEHIGLRTTRLYHPRNHETITLPNNQLATKRIVNLTGPDMRFWVMVDVGVSYASDPEHVRRVLLEVVNLHARVLKEEGWAPLVIFKGFGESSLDFILRFAIVDYRERFGVASDIRFAVFKRFEQEGIEIPFPQRTLWIKEWPATGGSAGAGGGPGTTDGALPPPAQGGAEDARGA